MPFEVTVIIDRPRPDQRAAAHTDGQEIEAAYSHVAARAGVIITGHTTLPRTRQNNRSGLYLVAEYPLIRLSALPDPSA